MIMDSRFWSDAWKKTRSNSSLGKGYPNIGAWKDFWNLAADRYALRNRNSMNFHENLLLMLEKEGVFSSSSEVIDVGCGPGTFALPLAKKVKKVVGLDTADEMLQILLREAAVYGVEDRVEILCRDWSEIPEEKNYDLVFASKSPAVFDYDSLLKMNGVSRDYCCLITFTGKQNFSLRNALWEKVTGLPLQSAAFDFIFPFNILYCEGYLPNLKFLEHSDHYRESLEYWYDYYRCYFKIFGYEGRDTAQRIKNYLEGISHHGICEHTEKSTIAVIWWNVHK